MYYSTSMQFDQIIKDIKANNINLYIFICNEPYYIDKIEQLISSDILQNKKILTIIRFTEKTFQLMIYQSFKKIPYDV